MPEDIEPRGALATPQPAMKADLRRDGPAVLFLAVLFLASISLAMAFSATFDALGIRAFEDPDSVWNPIIYLVIVIAFTAVILVIAKFRGIRILIKYFVLGSVLVTIYYVAWPLLALALGQGSPVGPAEIAGGVLAIALTALLWFYPEWYVIDAVGVAVAAGAAGIFGVSIGILPSLLLLVVFAVYDAIAVYRTKHMLSLADSVLELQLPIMFVVPKTWRYSFLEEKRRVRNPDPNDKPEAREAMFMGLGDAVFPAILVVSALTFLPATILVAGLPGPLVVALAAMLGSLLGLGVLMWFVLKGKPQAGLPLLNGGAIVGFLAALLPLYGLAPLVPHF